MNPYKGEKDPKTGKDMPKIVKKPTKDAKGPKDKIPGGGRNGDNKNMPPVTEALQSGVSMYIAGAAVPRFVSNTGTASDMLKLWNNGADGKGYMVDKDANPLTYFMGDAKIKGYDKKALWSARLSPDQDRLEDPCVEVSGAVAISGYDSCIKAITESTQTAPVVPPAGKRLLATATTVSSSVAIDKVPDCVALYLESCCTSTASCSSQPILTPGVITIADKTCQNVLIMEEICGQEFNISLSGSVQLIAGLAGAASLLAVLAL